MGFFGYPYIRVSFYRRQADQVRFGDGDLLFYLSKIKIKTQNKHNVYSEKF